MRPRKKALALIPMLPLASFAMLDAYAANLVVSTLADEQTDNAACSVREAVLNANSNDQSGSADCPSGTSRGLDTITFSVAGTVVLSSTLPAISDSAGTTIDGGGNVTISGNKTVRVISVSAGATLNVQNVTIVDGFRDIEGGGGIANSGTLNLIESTLSGNVGVIAGGGIRNYPTATANVSNSTFAGNRARPSAFQAVGGAILNEGTLNVRGTTFSDNSSETGSGGAIFNTGSLTVNSSVFVKNGASDSGGAIFGEGNTSTITSSTFLGNTAGDIGGGIAHYSGTLDVINSTFSGNTASRGAIFQNVFTGPTTFDGTTTLRNTLLAKNAGGNCAGKITDGGGGNGSDSCLGGLGADTAVNCESISNVP
jgi:predicted outer membrane repeat protein